MTVANSCFEPSLRALRGGMIGTLEHRAQEVAQQQMDFMEAFSALVQDDRGRRRFRLIERRFALTEIQSSYYLCRTEAFRIPQVCCFNR